MRWNAADSIIACPLTNTSLPVPNAWQPDVRRIDPSEIVVLPAPDRLGAVLVRGAQGGITGSDLLDDFRRALELVGFPVPAEIPDDAAADLNEPLLLFIDLNFQTRLMSSEFAFEPPYAGAFLFTYHLAQRDGAVCRLATLERKEDGTQRVSTVLDGFRSPGLQTVPTTTSTTNEANPATPAVTCRGWPVWMLPVCRAAASGGRRTSSP